MRIVDAVMEILKEDGLDFREIYKRIVERSLYNFGAKKPD